MTKQTMTGVVTSTKMTGSVVVEVTSRNPHPLYKKLIKRSKKYIAAPNGVEVKQGDVVVLAQTRKAGAKKYFQIERKAK